MPIFPSDPDKRWNFWLGIGILGFGLWIILIVVGQIFGDNTSVKDDALLIVAVGGFLTILLNQYRHQMNEEKNKKEE